MQFVHGCIYYAALGIPRDAALDSLVSIEIVFKRRNSNLMQFSLNTAAQGKKLDEKLVYARKFHSHY